MNGCVYNGACLTELQDEDEIAGLLEATLDEKRKPTCRLTRIVESTNLEAAEAA